MYSTSAEAICRMILPSDAEDALLIGRVWYPDRNSQGGRAVPVIYHAGKLLELSRLAPTMAQILMRVDLLTELKSGDFPELGELEPIALNSLAVRRDPNFPYLLAPCDLQPVKACGVTYIASVMERLVEERSGGDPNGLDAARKELEGIIGGSLADIVPGSSKAAELKASLQASGHWSHYLEVAIGPDAESFSKAQPMAAVGFGADIGVRSDSHWNNPEPELVLAVDPTGRIVGAALGNDVNLRDFEGRSPMLLDKAKDNNASAAIGPFVRLFDDLFTIDDARATVLKIRVEGQDRYYLETSGDVSGITRSFENLVSQVMGQFHNYPDGLMLFTGTMWVPVDDRFGDGRGFSHKNGDYVTISADRLGLLTNRTRPAEVCPPWTFGLAALIDQIRSHV